MTEFQSKCDILAELWISYRHDPVFEDYMQHNDLGLPLAYAVAEGIVKSTDLSAKFINESFDLLLVGMGIEDEGFEGLEDLLSL